MRFDELMKLLPKITIRVPPFTGPDDGNTSWTTGGGGPAVAMHTLDKPDVLLTYDT